METLSVSDMVLTLLRFGLILAVLYGTLALIGAGIVIVIAWLRDMFLVLWESNSGPLVVGALLLLAGAWIVWEVWTTPVKAFWK